MMQSISEDIDRLKAEHVRKNERRGRQMARLALWAVIVGAGALWFGVVYVALHFIIKFW